MGYFGCKWMSISDPVAVVSSCGRYYFDALHNEWWTGKFLELLWKFSLNKETMNSWSHDFRIKQEVLRRSPTFIWCETGRIENDASRNASIVACEFVAAVTFLPSCCLTIGKHACGHRLMGRVCEVRRWDGLRCRDKLAKFRKYSAIQKLIRGDTDSMVIA
jgi:hypothetical protein